MSYLIQDGAETIPDRDRMARDVAAIVGGSVEVEPGRYGHAKISIEGFSIAFYRQHGAKSARVRVSAWPPHSMTQRLPTHSRGPVDWPEMTVSAEKSGEQIAADVSRRILPQAREAFAALQTKLESLDTARASQVAAAEALQRAAPGVRISVSDDPNARIELSYWTEGGASVSGHVASDGGLYLERVRVPADSAAAVLAAICGKSAA